MFQGRATRVRFVLYGDCVTPLDPAPFSYLIIDPPLAEKGAQ
jgi:hypothetical protein